MDGWIKLHRAIMANRIYPHKRKFTEMEAWVDLMLKASHKDHTVSDIEVGRGQILTSILALGERWKWSRGKVKRFLKVCEKRNEVVLKTTTKFTVVTLCNYERYQGSQNDNGHQTDIKRTSNGHQTDTINNGKKIRRRTSVGGGGDFGPQELLDLYNEMCISRPRAKSILPKTKRFSTTTARLKEHPDREFWVRIFEAVEASDHLTGQTEGSWTGATFDWITNPNNLTKIDEGNYAPRGKQIKLIKDF